jgi:7-cyano-7-deazaguanine tRNA-ribosyltransferase
MSFEVLDKDLAGRIGRLKTRRGTIETPYLFPVINPFDATITVKDIEKLGFNAFITNILHVRRALRELKIIDVHDLLGFPGPIMTDSGAYQLLVYGEVDITPEEAVALQERCGSDIAVILDYPTGTTSYDEALRRVNETIERARALQLIRSDETILWVGPVQGAPYIDLVRRCAKQLSMLDFDIYAIGSPTTIMETYNYEALVDIIYASKTILPLGKPVHLFGAGHPMMLPVAVALGCDLFDSASYILYAKENRYMTPYGTYKLQNMEYFPCSCPICSKHSPQELKEMSSNLRIRLMALHNLYALASELRRTKQLIKEGSLWEYVSLRSRAHPRLFSAFLKFKKYRSLLERLDPRTKPLSSGLFFYDYHDISGPKVTRHLKKLKNCLSNLQGRILILIPRKDSPLFENFVKELIKRIHDTFGNSKEIKVLLYDFPFCLIPIELDGFFPLSQYEAPSELDMLSKAYVSSRVAKLLRILKPKAVLLYNDVKRWSEHLEIACRKPCNLVKVLRSKELYTIEDLENLFCLLRELVGS